MRWLMTLSPSDTLNLQHLLRAPADWAWPAPPTATTASAPSSPPPPPRRSPWGSPTGTWSCPPQVSQLPPPFSYLHLIPSEPGVQSWPFRSEQADQPARTDRQELLPIKVKSILKSEQPHSKNYNGGGSRSTIPDVTSFFLDKEDGTLVWIKCLLTIRCQSELFLYKNTLLAKSPNYYSKQRTQNTGE